jgi:hypothetical protein
VQKVAHRTTECRLRNLDVASSNAVSRSKQSEAMTAVRDFILSRLFCISGSCTPLGSIAGFAHAHTRETTLPMRARISAEATVE